MDLRKIRAAAAEAAMTGRDLNQVDAGEQDDEWEDDGDSMGESGQARYRRAGAAAAELSARITEALQKLVAEGGEKYADLRFSASVQARPKAQKKSAAPHLIDLILTSEGAPQSQAALRRTIKARYPALTIPNDWRKTLPSWAKKSVEDKLKSRGAPFDKIKLPAQPTLADLHQRAKHAVLSTRSEATILNEMLTITEDKLLIGTEAFNITTSRQGKYEYRRALVPIDRLLAMAAG